MAGQGAGPSRRSHTKSRKGCKTCKRRHIRCDESFPQCNNCTKHQVRCDYMDAVPSDTENGSPTDQSALQLTPKTEETICSWQQTGDFPYPELEIYPLPHPSRLNKTDLYLINNLASICSNLSANRVTKFAIWADGMPRSISLASSYPFVLHALLSFSANQLAFATGSSDLRQLSIEHGGIALRELHEAIGNFSKSNADGVLSASVLLVCQSTDFRSWSSLIGGIHSVGIAMEPWRNESLFADLINAYLVPNAKAALTKFSMPSLQERFAILHNVATPLQHLLSLLGPQSSGRTWVEQMLNYVSRLQACEPAVTPEEQFSHCYVLRKWLYWVPIHLLQLSSEEGCAMLILAHLYATGLALIPLFPDVGTALYGTVVAKPLEELLVRITSMPSQQGYDQHAMELSALLQFPRNALAGYRERYPWVRPRSPTIQQIGFEQGVSFDVDSTAYSHPGGHSPAFIPSNVHLSPAASQARSQSPFFDVAVASSPYEHQALGYGASPCLPSQGFASAVNGQRLYDYASEMPMDGYHSGFVSAPPVWT